VDNSDEIRTFLSSRRAKITPAQAGLPERGRRKVPGLRRGEVAELAGVSIEYYSQLERGSLAGASDSVLWPGRFNWTRPSVHTFTTSPAPAARPPGAAAGRPHRRRARAFSTCSTA